MASSSNIHMDDHIEVQYCDGPQRRSALKFNQAQEHSIKRGYLCCTL